MMEKDKKYLITGGAGYLGQELIKRLILQGFSDLLVMSRNEGQLIEMQQKFPHVKIITGDISNPYFCDKAMRAVAGVYHLAAFKHVGLAETNTVECVQSNVIGTMNLLEASRKNKPEFMIGISTDKAAKVSGIYGATKLIQERLFAEYEVTNPDTKYRTVRYGNVLYSTGSVLCKWKDAIQKNEEVVITDPNSTRFYWTVEQAVDLIFDCLENANNSTPHITRMKSIRAGDLLDAMKLKYGPYIGTTREIGLQPGENQHEVVGAGLPSSEDAERYTVEEIMELI
jgi:UDP-N-acetylglucosamine 4,6-dehydratase/UDP-glucose 4-epimerase